MTKRRGEYVTSTQKRSFIKAFTWELIAFIITLIAVFLIYGDIKMSIKFTLGLTFVKVLFLYAHERIWKRIIWGKILCKKQS
jgi:adenylylsulfate kinase